MCLVLLLLLAAKADGLKADSSKALVDPVRRSDNFSSVVYNNTNGLPTSEANAIAQTSEGFIWIGSYSGLVRYDGNTFERMDSTTGVSSVISMHVDQQDRLWVGTNESGLALMEEGEFTMFHEKDGLGSDKICAIEEDDNGTIYVGTTKGITMISPDMTFRKVEDPQVADLYIERMSPGKDGQIYCITNDDILFTLQDGKLVDYIDHNETNINAITCILSDPDSPGEVYIGTEGSEFYHGDPKQDPDMLDYVDISPLYSVLDIKKIGDQIWICTRSGIGVLDEDGFHSLQNLPLDNSINQVMKDYEGNLWFVSSRQGVMKLVNNSFADVFSRYDLTKCVVNSTCLLDGDLYVATDTGMIVLGDEEQITSVPLTEAKTARGADLEETDLIQMLDGCRIRSIIRDSKDRLWISTWRACGLLRYEKGTVKAFTVEDGLLSDHIRMVYETADGSFLVVNSGGISILKDDQVIASYGKEQGIDNPESLTACEAPNGDILLGSNGGGLYVINEQGVRCIGTKDGLTSGIIMRIKYDAERQLFWIVTSNSLAYMSTDYKVTSLKKFPYSNNFDLYENSKGDMWILSSNGIYILPAEELIANGEMKPVHYGMANGLPCISTSNSYNELTPEGDLYMAGTSGIAKMNIESSLEDVSDLKQAVPFVDTDGVRLYPDEDGSFTLPADIQKLTIYAFVYNYSLTDPKVSYYLEGFEDEEIMVSRSELTPVTYTNLPGGSYKFVMELKDALGRGSNTLSVPIIKQRALYEHTWFYCLCGLGLVLLVALLERIVVRRKMRIMEVRHREEAERERIGNELDMATRIQKSMLPHQFPPFPDRTEFDIYASMDPAREVGGDFYDFFLIDDDHLCMVMADVSGKGVPAALFMMASKIILQSCAMLGQSAGEILTKTNEAICSNNQAEMFITVWLGILEISTGKVTAANAGHEYPVLMQDGIFTLMKDKHGLVIGGMEGVKYKEYEFMLKPGDKLFVYTDGVPEATAAGDVMFGIEKMVSALNKNPRSKPEQILKNVRTAVDDFVKDAEQFDDLTMLCMEYKGI